jgi:hypothetical protein
MPRGMWNIVWLIRWKDHHRLVEEGYKLARDLDL